MNEINAGDNKNLPLLMSLSFTSLGFLIGNLVGMTSTSVVSALIPLLFAFGGGSAIAFLQKLDSIAQKKASIAILCLSLACVMGVYTGIIISEHQLLSPKNKKSIPDTRSERAYLRSINTISIVNIIESQRAKGNLTTEEAYEQLKESIIQSNSIKNE